MTPWIAWLIAAVCAAAFVALCQAADNYNHALPRPWVYIPARIMGFRRAPEEPEPGPIDGRSHAE